MKKVMLIAIAFIFIFTGTALAAFLQASGSTTQPIGTTPEAAIIDQIDTISGFSIYNAETVQCRMTGYYLVVSAPQFGTVCGNKGGYATAWLEVNGVDLPNSNVLKDLHPVKTKDVIISQSVIFLRAGDRLRFMVAGSNDSECQALEAIDVEGQPLVPSIIVSIVKAY